MGRPLPLSLEPLDGDSASGGNGVTLRLREGGGVYRVKYDDLLSRPIANNLPPAERARLGLLRAQRWQAVEEQIQRGKRHPELQERIAWPLCVRAHVEAGVRRKGIVMRDIAPAAPLDFLADPRRRNTKFPNARLSDVLATACSYTRAVMVAHKHGYVIRDSKPDNILVTPMYQAVLIDADSFARVDSTPLIAHDVSQFPYRAPELMRTPLMSVRATQIHDLFAMAQILYALLMGVEHGFVAHMLDRSEPDMEGWLAAYKFPASMRRPMTEPIQFTPNRPSFSDLPPPVRTLFEDAYAPQGAQMRPTAAQWHAALDRWLKQERKPVKPAPPSPRVIYAPPPAPQKPPAVQVVLPPPRLPAPIPLREMIMANPQQPAPPAAAWQPPPVPTRLSRHAPLIKRVALVGVAAYAGVTFLPRIPIANAWRAMTLVETHAAAPPASASVTPEAVALLSDVTILRRMIYDLGPVGAAARKRLQALADADWRDAAAARSFGAMFAFHEKWKNTEPDTAARYAGEWESVRENLQAMQLDAVKTTLRDTPVFEQPNSATTAFSALPAGANVQTLGTFTQAGRRWTVINRSVVFGESMAWPYAFVPSDAIAAEPTQAAPVIPLDGSPSFNDRHWLKRNGRVTLSWDVSEHGAVENVRVESQCPAGYGYDQIAIDEVKARQFTPGTEDGQPVRQRLRTTFSWWPKPGRWMC